MMKLRLRVRLAKTSGGSENMNKCNFIASVPPQDQVRWRLARFYLWSNKRADRNLLKAESVFEPSPAGGKPSTMVGGFVVRKEVRQSGGSGKNNNEGKYSCVELSMNRCA
jgi:hypothetical protein